jgi:hypothetical protein
MHRPRTLLAGIACAIMVMAACEPEMVPVDPANLPAQPDMSCVAVPPSVCQQMLTDARNNAPQGAFPIRLHITCTRMPCTIARGEAESAVVFSNGETTTMGFGWEGVPMP